MIRYLTDNNFEDSIKDGLVLVDFYADWCGPCKMLGTVLEELDIDVLKVNTDEYSELAMRFGIMSIPTLILFKDGVEVNKMIGLQSKSDILAFIEENK